MDTATYPDKNVQEILKGYVCIRVEHDQNPELVKQYKVKSLPDVRLLDSEGKETAKLVGFTGAVKLSAALSGKNKPAAESVRKVVVSPDAIRKAIKEGSDYLRAAWRQGWTPNPGMDPASQLLFALVAAKAEIDEKLIESVTTAELSGTYEVAFQAMALATLDPKKYQDRLRQCAKFLVDTQLENGQWTYGPAKSGTPPKIGDNSNTAFALLGLAYCRKAGIEVPEPAIKKALACWRACQNSDGGWGYRTDRETESYASMTESGISSLLIYSDKEDSVKRGLAWLDTHFSASENKQSAYQQGRLLYHLYAMERVGQWTAIGNHDWFQQGAAFLLGTQRGDGSWDDGAETPISNTSFALLFLTRATRTLK